jgi:outer membrane protein assembly factor BamB
LLCIRATDGEILWQRTVGHAELLGAQKAEAVLAEFAAVEEKKRELHREYSDLRKDASTPQAQLDKYQQAALVLEGKRNELARHNPPPIHNGGAGNSAATPVCDGQRVYTVFGTGIVAAHSLDGQRQWIRFVEAADIGFGHSSTPTLVDGKLILHIKDLVALDAANGKELWRIELRARHASAIVVRVGDQPLLVSPAGAIVRVSDGEVLASPRALSLSESSPVIDRGVLFAQSGQTYALRLPTSVGQPFEPEVLWEGKASRGRRTPSPVFHDGLLYGVTTDGIMDVTDAATGKTLYQKRLDLGQVYSSITSAGNLLYLSSTKGTTIVLRSGRKYDEIARNELEGFGSCPVFVGDRMYIRARGHLYCIANGGAKKVASQ